jgi:hypothetical protein
LTGAAVGFGDDETGLGRRERRRNLLILIWRGFDRNQGEGTRAAHIKPEFSPRVRDAGRKAILVDAPEHIEIGWGEVPYGKWHPAIVAGRGGRRPKITGFRGGSARMN